MASFVYNYGKSGFCDGTLNWVSGGGSDSSWKTMLVTNAYTANPDDHFVSTANSAELSGTGYQSGFGGTGRKSLLSRVVTTNTTNDRAELTASNVSWSAINAGTIKAAIIYRHLTTDADSILVAYIDLTSVATNGGDITIQWAAAGVINLT